MASSPSLSRGFEVRMTGRTDPARDIDRHIGADGNKIISACLQGY